MKVCERKQKNHVLNDDESGTKWDTKINTWTVNVPHKICGVSPIFLSLYSNIAYNYQVSAFCNILFAFEN